VVVIKEKEMKNMKLGIRNLLIIIAGWLALLSPLLIAIIKK
jgi:hypothetical protein